MWLVSLALLAVTLHGRPDGPELLITIGNRRGLDLAQTAPPPPADRAGWAHRTSLGIRTNRTVPESGVAHRGAAAPSTPDPNHPKHKTSITNAHKLSSNPTADGASVTDHHRIEISNELQNAASAPSAAPTIPVPIQPTANTAWTTPSSPSSAPAAPQPWQRPPPRPSSTDPAGQHGVADPKAQRNGGHSAGHKVPDRALSRRPRPILCTGLPRRDATLNAPSAQTRTAPRPTTTTARADEARAPQCPLRTRCLPRTSPTSR